MKELDIEKLRKDLLNYFGSATCIYPNAFMKVIEVQNASEDELINIAIFYNFNLENYVINNDNKYYR